MPVQVERVQGMPCGVQIWVKATNDGLIAYVTDDYADALGDMAAVEEFAQLLYKL
ncbi:hypothetical protein [Streptomyces sp. NPDC012888]|uniref:hypothetical protein n=1 Tax=Streptomyces sp. NPDC012888 TaxID=3364855 RepID=UPI00369EDC96